MKNTNITEKLEVEKTIDMTPSWRGILPMLLRVLECGSPEGKQHVINELGKMATAADRYNEIIQDK